MAGLDAARARGRVGGRPKKLDDEKLELMRSLHSEKKYAIKDICEMVGVSKQTLYNHLENIDGAIYPHLTRNVLLKPESCISGKNVPLDYPKITRHDLEPMPLMAMPHKDCVSTQFLPRPTLTREPVLNRVHQLAIF